MLTLKITLVSASVEEIGVNEIEYDRSDVSVYVNMKSDSEIEGSEILIDWNVA